MEWGGEVTKAPQISQGGSTVTVTVRSKKNAWGDHQIAARLPLNQEIAAISEKKITTPL